MAQNWNSKVQFPSDSDFVIRITDANFGPSKRTQNPMITVEWEIVSPVDKEIGGVVYNMAGIASMAMNHLYWTTKVAGDAEKSENTLKRLTSDGEPLGLLRVLFPDNPEYADKFDPENPSQEVIDGLKGKHLFVQMSPDVNPQRKNPTSAQIEAAKKTGARPEGDIQKHPVTGVPLVQYTPKVREIFGLAPDSIVANKPY